MAGEAGMAFEWRGEEARPDPGVSIAELVLDRLRHHARHTEFPAQVFAPTGSALSFGELLRLSVRAAGAWRAAGLGPGKMLAVFARNTEALFPAVLGALMQGVTLTGISPTSTEVELRHCLSLVEPDIILCDASNAALASSVAPECALVVQDGAVVGARPLADVMEQAAEAVDEEAYRPAEVGDVHQHVAVVFFSSGSTGMPKAIMISNHALVMFFTQAGFAFRCVYGERMLTTSLMSWITGIGLLVDCTLHGTTRVCDNFTSPAALLASLRKYEIHCWFTAPPLLLLVAEAARAEGRDEQAAAPAAPCPSLRAVVVGGTTLPASTEEALSRAFRCDIYQAYGTTEFMVPAAARPPLRPGSVGRLVPGVRVRLVNPDTGADIREAGVVGEFRVVTPCLMLGYKGNAEATARAMDARGFFCSGDLAYLDEDGYVFIVGRLKELLKYRGTKVAPAEVEAVLCTHPDVAEACVVGRPHRVCGDVPAACVVRRPGPAGAGAEAKLVAELQALVATRLSDAKRLRGGVVFARHIPKTANGKVARSDVVALFDGVPMLDVD